MHPNEANLRSKTGSIAAALAVACGLAFVAPLAAQQEITVESSHGPIFIPDHDADFPIQSSIFVDPDFQIADLNVTLDIEHQSIGDLEIDLYSPSGRRVRIVDEVCSDSDNFPGTVFDDESPVGIGEVCPPGDGTFRPDGDFDKYDGHFSRGIWTLVVNDDKDGESGYLNGWSMTITGDFVTSPIFSRASVVSAASFQGGAVAVGEMTSIFGAALGPPEGVVAQFDDQGKLPTELEGVQVFFDGEAAPLFYVSSSQINAQIPFDITPGSNIAVQVRYSQTGAGQTVTPVIEAGPAVFTLNGRGQGHAVARNPNGSVNDANNPIAPGDTIRVFGTGFGAVDPPVESGQPAPTEQLSRVMGDVTASVGGVPGEVTFAGLAPGYVALYQLDIKLGPDTPTGQIVPLQITMGDHSLENLTWITVGSE